MAKQRNKLFDIFKAAGPSKEPHVGSFSPAGEKDDSSGDLPPQTMEVSQLLNRIKAAMTAAFPSKVVVVGEISNLSMPRSGHLYFSLKDRDSSVGACMWKSAAEKLKFTPADGMEVIVEGKVDVYPAQGKLQLYVQKITPRGVGALELAFRQLREKLQAAGLFDSARKKNIPAFPRAVGVITSATGAAVRDIQRTIRRRFPAMDVYLLPAMVQGDAAAAELAAAVRLMDANAEKFGIDTIIIARGGGSLEDLWPFNEEVLALAISQAKTPIISGVGHEVDVTICDLVADLRAATPTAAAEHAVPERSELLRRLAAQMAGMTGRVTQMLGSAKLALRSVRRSSVFRDPAGGVRHKIQRVDELSARLVSSQRGLMSYWTGVLSPLSHRLAALHPARLYERAAARLERITSLLRWVLGGRSKTAGEKLALLQRRLTRRHPANGAELASQKIDLLERHLNAMSYRSVLQRGYSVTRGPDGGILKSASAVAAGDVIKTELADGKITSSVTEADGAKSPGVTQEKKPRRKNAPAGPGLFDF